VNLIDFVGKLSQDRCEAQSRGQERCADGLGCHAVPCCRGYPRRLKN
jgi:hypothetical protein